MVALEPVVQAYAWGSRTALPELCGITSPAPHPVAEHWFGAHDSGSSRCSDGRGLDDPSHGLSVFPARVAADGTVFVATQPAVRHARVIAA